MLNSDEGDFDVFFDSVDHLPSEESVVAKEELGCVHLEYGVWMDEPQSVRERRESFLRGMGLAEFASSKICAEERVKECNGEVPSSSSSSTDCTEDSLVCGRRDGGNQANAIFDELEREQEDKPKVGLPAGQTVVSVSAQERVEGDAHAPVEEFKNLDVGRSKLRSWLRRFASKSKRKGDTCATDVSNPNLQMPVINRMKVQQNKKAYMELTALYSAQEIRAHRGLIWTMKFSPDGQYLASGGEDGVVRIWQLLSADVSYNHPMFEDSFGFKVKGGKSTLGGKTVKHPSIVIPDKVLHIEESPLQEFYGHSGGVLDLSWSNSNCLLSSSKDKTVRLWQVGRGECLSVFRHSDYVTCVQFNPVDENYFISGSIDGKVRIWGVSEKRVVDWADVRDVITALCYQPDGNGFIVGSIIGTCHFYDASEKQLNLYAQIRIEGRKRTSANKITGIQFSQERSQRVMITAEDSKIRVFDGIDIVHKYKGLPKSGSQMSASFTPSGKHIISIGRDSRVFIWNYNGLCIPLSRQTKSVHSCEHFFSEGATVAIPWSGTETRPRGSWSASPENGPQAQDHKESASWIRDSERFSLSTWFFMDGPCKCSVTWPEEKLPVCDAPVSENEFQDQPHEDHQQEHNGYAHKHRAISDTWGLVIVTAGRDGTIRTFHNYGLPVRL